MPGPTPGQLCTVCQSTFRADVDAMLRDGKTYADIARATGLGKQRIGRHARNGHSVLNAASTPSQSGSRTGGDDSPVGVLREALDALRAMDPAHLSASAQVMRIDAIRRGAEALTKIQPPRPREVPPLHEHPDWNGFFVPLFKTLEPYPVVRHQLGEASGIDPRPVSDLEFWSTVDSLARRGVSDAVQGADRLAQFVAAQLSRRDAETGGQGWGRA